MKIVRTNTPWREKRARAHGPVAALLTCLLLLGSASCASEGTSSDEDRTSLTEPREALSEELMVSLAQAKNFHHKADVHLKDAQLDHAITSVRKILAIPFPPQAPEGQDVLLDARARLAKLLITQGDLDEAMKVASDGIEAKRTSNSGGPRETFFLANLYTVRGHVWEAKAQHADEQADSATSKSSRKNAIIDFDRSITINNAVLRRLTGKSSQ